MYNDNVGRYCHTFEVGGFNCCNTGCMSGDTIINHLMYADDLVLISPSATGMKELLCACEVYSLEHAIIYNPKKSTVLVYGQGSQKLYNSSLKL